MTKEAAQRVVELTAKLKELEWQRLNLTSGKNKIGFCRKTDYEDNEEQWWIEGLHRSPSYLLDGNSLQKQLLNVAYDATIAALDAMIKEAEAELERL